MWVKPDLAVIPEINYNITNHVLYNNVQIDVLNLRYFDNRSNREGKVYKFNTYTKDSDYNVNLYIFNSMNLLKYVVLQKPYPLGSKRIIDDKCYIIINITNNCIISKLEANKILIE